MRKPLSKRKEYKYIKKVIDSCQNHLHLQSVTKMITNFQRVHDRQEFTLLDETSELLQYMMWRKEKVEYMNKTKLKG
jgi:hypothetical protein